ncbi:hypothetical protein niasHS_009516 [Heterodera schachtii]|uniref:BTB domain-containing protein n=1 Tax=Heterodera schachtii TaxID=97005 RepID=A0ABD2J307_HETSC
MSQLVVKHLLSTGKDADVYFLVGDGDAKELLPTHKMILKHASEVFAAMFRFDAKNVKAEFAVEVTDVEAAAFKVMLSFIYADDLSELNGDNAMAVLYAENTISLIWSMHLCNFPISELRNVFFLYAQALLFELEDFASKCLSYICQNAAQLFGSDDFLKIDQKMLCVLLDRNHLTLGNEFEIWKAALRWADEKCRQSGIECSSGNRRSILGPALFKIRFPNIHDEDFAKCVVPSGVLTMEELFGIYQFNYHPYLFFRGVPELCSLKFPSHGRIFNWNKAKDNKRGTLALEIEKMSKFAQKTIGSECKSETVHIGGFPWKIWAIIEKKNESTDKNEKWLCFALLCDAPKEDKNWSCKCSTNYRIVSQKSGVQDFKIGEFTNEDTFNIEVNCWGYVNFISFAELLNPNKGFYNKSEDKVTLAIDVIVK